MQPEFEKFNELPPALKMETAQNLSNHDLVNLAQTSKYHSGASLVAEGLGGARGSLAGAHDLDAMTALCKVRTNDFIDLKS
ncbi:hypothetical protein Lsan_1212 [Legionella santicrucis]|uniref:F-box domain-containing protein n=1 Tax=Legionella santicrucis TaxID=45074 RepID=A0A0W0Z4R9_9GAMM|nr:hypothetical protein [Legionella santicrucis]KTD63779.1 hypothetical protein Lsan_1212 [Legionella santicrucis]